MGKYRLGFEPMGLLLFLIIMAPNILWFALPAPEDVLREPSATEVLDGIASVFQVLMAASLCGLRRRDLPKPGLPPIAAGVCLCCLLYYACWGAYYGGIVCPAVLLGLAAFPCLGFLLFAAGRKNFIALGFTLVFTVCHMIFAAVNFLL